MEQLRPQIAATAAADATADRTPARPRVRLSHVLAWSTALALTALAGSALVPAHGTLVLRTIPDVPYELRITSEEGVLSRQTLQTPGPVDLTAGEYAVEIVPLSPGYKNTQLAIHMNGRTLDLPVVLSSEPSVPLAVEAQAEEAEEELVPDEAAPVESPQGYDLTDADRMMLSLHKPLVLPIPDVTRAMVGDTSIVHVQYDAEMQQLTLSPVGTGSTSLIVWTNEGLKNAWVLDVNATGRLPKKLTLQVNEAIVGSDEEDEELTVTDNTIATAELYDGKVWLRGLMKGKTTLVVTPIKGKPQRVELIVK